MGSHQPGLGGHLNGALDELWFFDKIRNQNVTHAFVLPGLYDVVLTVSDTSSCTSSDTVQVTVLTCNLPPVAVDDTATVRENSGSNGSIDLTVSGGTAPYSFNWNTGATSEDLSGLAPGTYVVTVMDVIGCTSVDSVTLTGATISLASRNCPVNKTDDNPPAFLGSLTPSATAYPNPFNYAINIELEMPMEGELTIEILDLTGKKIWSEEFGRIQPGKVYHAWGGVNADGAPQSSGIYYARIQMGDHQEILKLVLQR